MEKTVVILKIVLLTLLIFTLVGVLVLFINKDFKFNLNAKLVYDQNITEEFNKIDISTDSLDVKFVKSNDDTVNVKIYDNEDNDVIVEVENETLKIVSNKKNTCFFCMFQNRKVIITLPEKIYDLVIDTKSGDINSEIDFNKVNIVSTSGDIKFNNIKKAFVKITSGDIEIKEVDDLKVKSTSGDLEINKINKHIDIKTTSGDIEINNLNLTKNSNITVTSGDIMISKASKDIYYNTSVISGDVNIKNNNRHADIELMISAKSGDIIVKN